MGKRFVRRIKSITANSLWIRLTIIEIKAGKKGISSYVGIELPLRILVCLHQVNPILGDADGVVFRIFWGIRPLPVFLGFECSSAVSGILKIDVAASISARRCGRLGNDNIHSASVVDNQAAFIVAESTRLKSGMQARLCIDVVVVAKALVIVLQRDIAMVVNPIDDLGRHVGAGS